MNAGSSSATAVCVAVVIVMIPLVAATWLLPAGLPLFLRQLVLSAWGVGAIVVAERALFSRTAGDAARAIGFVHARRPALVLAALVSVPMWTFLPLLAWSQGVPVGVRPDWLLILAGVALVNGIAEEVIHRGFCFGHLRQGRAFGTAAALSALLFTVQHLYLVVTMGWTVGMAAVLLAALLAFPLALVFERGGRSIGGPAILHTSSNAPVMVLALPSDFVATALVPHMVVVLISLCLVFAVPQRAFGAPELPPR